MSTESDPTTVGVPSTNEDTFDDEKSVKKVIDETPEETFKIDYGELNLKICVRSLTESSSIISLFTFRWTGRFSST